MVLILLFRNKLGCWAFWTLGWHPMSNMETCHYSYLLSFYLGHSRLPLGGVISLFEMQEINNYDREWGIVQQWGSWLIFMLVTFTHVIWHIQQSASATRNKLKLCPRSHWYNHVYADTSKPRKKSGHSRGLRMEVGSRRMWKKRAAGKLLSWRVCGWLRPMCSTFRRKTLRHSGSSCAWTCVLLHSSRLRVCPMIMMSTFEVQTSSSACNAVTPSSDCVQEEEGRKRDDVTGIVLPVAASPLCPTLSRGILLYGQDAGAAAF